MLRLKQILNKYTKETKKEATKRTGYTADPWMHDQMKKVLQINRQRIITSK